MSYLCGMKKIICWWSGGITSAVSCKVAIDLYGKERCDVVMIDTKNEDPDTYRFLKDCEDWYGTEIKTITMLGDKFHTIQDVWRHYKSLNVAHGAICSTELKRAAREKYQKENDYDYQVFGFEFDKKEFNRAKSLKLNHPKSKSIYPLLLLGYDKSDCIKIVEEAGIRIPITYSLGFRNNNCFNTGCVQGGIGYWQKMKTDQTEKFDAMADLEHELTNLKESPVTMLKDQSAAAKESGNTLVFLKKHPAYPNLKCIDDFPQMKVEPLFECNGFCGTNDLNKRSTTELELNFQMED